MTKVVFEVIEREVPLRASLRQLKRNLSDELFKNQECSLCEGQKVTAGRLLPFPDEQKMVNVKFLLHLIVHLSLPKIFGVLELPLSLKERVDWLNKRKRDELVVLFDGMIDPEPLLRSLRWAVRKLAPFSNGGTVK